MWRNLSKITNFQKPKEIGGEGGGGAVKLFSKDCFYTIQKVLANNNNISTTMTGKKVAVCSRGKSTECPIFFNWT